MVLVAGPADGSPYEFVASSDELVKALVQDPHKIVIIPKKWNWLSDTDLADHMTRFSSLWLVGTEGFETHSLRHFMNTGRVRGFLRPGDDLAPVIERLEKELKRSAKAKPNDQKSDEALFQANERLRALTQAMIGIQRASSIGEIEMVLNEALNPALHLSWVRIVFEQQSGDLQNARRDRRISISFKANAA